METELICRHEEEVHAIVDALIISFHGNMYFRTLEKSAARDIKLREIAASDKVKRLDDFLHYADETSFSSEGYFAN